MLEDHLQSLARVHDLLKARKAPSDMNSVVFLLLLLDGNSSANCRCWVIFGVSYHPVVSSTAAER